MLQQDRPDDYVIATGQEHSVREFAELAFGYLGLNWQDYIRVDERFFRPAESYSLRGDYAKAARVLGWRPSLSLGELVRLMVEADLAAVEKELKK